MAIFGLFGGGSAQQPAQEQPREHTTSADLFASTNFSQSQSQPQSQPGSSFIPDPPAAGPSTPQAAAPQLPSALDTFSSAYDPAKLHPLAGLGQNLDFLQLDEDKLTDMEGAASVLPSRGWTDDLCVGTGTTYVSGEYLLPDSRSFDFPCNGAAIYPIVGLQLTPGLAIGGAWGFKEGWSRQLGENASGKLRLNSILNGCTRRGTLLGNSLGVLGASRLPLSSFVPDPQLSSTT